MRRSLVAVLTGVTLASAAWAAPASATPRADFSYTPVEPRAGGVVSFFTDGSGCDARPCTYAWSRPDADGEQVLLGTGRSFLVRLDDSGEVAITLTVTNRGFRAPPGPTSASVTKVVNVGPPVDAVGPETTITSGPEETSASREATFDFTSEEGATFECRLDEGPWVACTSPATLTDLVDGDHLFAVRATDASGNVELAPDVYAWTIDPTPPPVDPLAGLDCHFGWVTFCTAPPPA
jgi:hypothetical protein